VAARGEGATAPQASSTCRSDLVSEVAFSSSDRASGRISATDAGHCSFFNSVAGWDQGAPGLWLAAVGAQRRAAAGGQRHGVSSFVCIRHLLFPCTHPFPWYASSRHIPQCRVSCIVLIPGSSHIVLLLLEYTVMVVVSALIITSSGQV
jgi:hypothetical protein